MDAKKQMNDYWHIPRASLASSSSAASTSAASNASTSNRSQKSHTHSNAPPPPPPPPAAHIAKHSANNINGSGIANIHRQQQHQQHQSPRYMVNNFNAPPMHGQRDDVRGAPKQKFNNVTTTTTTNNAGAKRGSRSSQGSSDSNNSTRSAASGSLLLTAANLERFAEIHRKQQKPNNPSQLYLAGGAVAATPNHYNANLVAASNDAVIVMDTADGGRDFVPKPNGAKELDNISLASSMHFTMVNGEGGPSSKKPKRGLCDRGRQVTVLIVSMSLIFLLLIMGMVYALEMRAREMPQS